ncbi:MAG: PAS domain-containing protein, partial [Exilispira sp.]
MIYNKNIIYKIYSFQLLIICLWSLLNNLYIVSNFNNDFKIYLLILIYIYEIYLSILLFYFYGADTKTKRINYIIFLLLLFLPLFLLKKYSNVFIIYLQIYNTLITLHQLLNLNKVKNKDIFYFIIFISFLISYYFSLLISLIFISNYKFWNIILSNLFPISYTLSILFYSKRFLLLNNIGGKWQNFIVNNSNQPFVFINSKNIIVYANNSFLDLSGYDFNFINNLNIDKIIDFNNSILIASNNEKLPVKIEIKLLKKINGNVLKAVFINSLKTLIKTEVLSESISVYKKKFMQFSALFQSLIDNFPKALVFFDQNGRIKKYNRKFKEFILLLNNNNFDEKSLFSNYILEIFKDLFIEKDLPLNEFISRINNKEIVIKGNYYYFKYIKLLNSKIFDFENLLIISDNTDVERIKEEQEKQYNLQIKFFEKINIPLCSVDQDGFIKNTNLTFSKNFKNFPNKCIFALNNALYHILRKSEKLIFNNKLVYLGDYLIETDK